MKYNIKIEIYIYGYVIDWVFGSITENQLTLNYQICESLDLSNYKDINKWHLIAFFLRKMLFAKS